MAQLGEETPPPINDASSPPSKLEQKRKQKKILVGVSGFVAIVALIVGISVSASSQGSSSEAVIRNTEFTQCSQYGNGDSFVYEGTNCSSCSKSGIWMYFEQCDNICTGWRLNMETLVYEPVPSTCNREVVVPELDYDGVCPPGFYNVLRKTGCNPQSGEEVLISQTECFFCESVSHTYEDCLDTCEAESSCVGFVANPEDPNKCYGVTQNMLSFCDDVQEDFTFCKKRKSNFLCPSQEADGVTFEEAQSRCSVFGGVVASANNEFEFLRLQGECVDRDFGSVGCWADFGEPDECFFVEANEENLTSAACTEKFNYCCDIPTETPTSAPTRSPLPQFTVTSPTPSPIEAAITFCDTQNADLIRINNQQEQDAAATACEEALALNPNACGCWMGLSSDLTAPTPNFLYFEDPFTPVDFFALGPGQPDFLPNDSGFNSRCYVLRKVFGFLWDDVDCFTGCGAEFDLPIPLCELETDAPTTSPTRAPTGPTTSPTKNPTTTPTTSPTRSPTLTDSPTDSPTISPTRSPTLTFAPTGLPTVDPTFAPTNLPTTDPTFAPTGLPTTDPTFAPTQLPTDSPTKNPTRTPTRRPTQFPTVSPTFAPTGIPTFSPTKNPTFSPTKNPTFSPSASPTVSPTKNPTNSPSVSPTNSPSSSPTTSPTFNPTNVPTFSPTDSPTTSPTASPTRNPTTSPTASPTDSPTTSPTDSPTTSPTKSPTNSPTSSPTDSPTNSPTSSPTSSPTTSPTTSPTKSPTNSPTDSPTNSPTISPSVSPTVSPTKNPTISPTANPTDSPTISPTKKPTSFPTNSPTVSPTRNPTVSPTVSPTRNPTTSPTTSPTNSPTSSPTDSPTVSPTTSPTVSPTKRPTTSPTVSPTLSPTKSPSLSPTLSPSTSPTVSPTNSPTISPTSGPTVSPTLSPSTSPTTSPTDSPTVSPTTRPTLSPTASPTVTPTGGSPTTAPTNSPTLSPTVSPTPSPSPSPTNSPTISPTSSPSVSPTSSPTNGPTTLPTSNPTFSPTDVPTFSPVVAPTKYPTASPNVGGVCKFKNGESLWAVYNDGDKDIIFHCYYPQNGHSSYVYDESRYPACSYHNKYCPLESFKVKPGELEYVVAPADAIDYFVYRRNCPQHDNFQTVSECAEYQGTAETPVEKCKCIDHAIDYEEDFESYDLGKSDYGENLLSRWRTYSDALPFIRSSESYNNNPEVCSTPDGKCLDLVGAIRDKKFHYTAHLDRKDELKGLTKYIDYHCTIHFQAAGTRRCGDNNYPNREAALADGCLEYFDTYINNDNSLKVKVYRPNDDLLTSVKFRDIPALFSYHKFSVTADVYDNDGKAYVAFFSEGQKIKINGKKQPIGNFIDDVKAICCCIELFDHYVYESVYRSQGATGSGLSVPQARSNIDSILAKPANDDFNVNYQGLPPSSQVYSLGFGGEVILKFDSGFSRKLIIYEETVLKCVLAGFKAICEFEDDEEDALVEVSVDGVNFELVTASIQSENGWFLVDPFLTFEGRRRSVTGKQLEDINDNAEDFDIYFADPEGINASGQEEEFFASNTKFRSFSRGVAGTKTYSEYFYAKKIRATKIYLPQTLSCYKYVRIKDNSVGGTKEVDDGFDLHAVKTTDVCCTDEDNDAFWFEQQKEADDAFFENFAIILTSGGGTSAVGFFVIAAIAMVVFILALISLRKQEKDKRASDLLESTEPAAEQKKKIDEEI